MVVREVRPENRQEMALAQDNHMVQAFATKRAAKAFRIWILPGRLRRRNNLFDTHALDSPSELLAVDAIAVADHVSGRSVLGEGFDDPWRSVQMAR